MFGLDVTGKHLKTLALGVAINTYNSATLKTPIHLSKSYVGWPKPVDVFPRLRAGQQVVKHAARLEAGSGSVAVLFRLSSRGNRPGEGRL